MSAKISFTEFQQSKQPCDDVHVFLGTESEDVKDKGFVYMDQLVIQDQNEAGEYYLLLCNEDWLDKNLINLEVRLYNFFVNEIL